MGNFDELFSEWAAEEKVKLTSKPLRREKTKPKRTYIHFDKRSDATSLILYKDKFRAKNIVSHAFWPFLKISLKTVKIKNKEIRKRDIKIRDVYYSSHRDALIYSWYSFLLNKLYNEKIKILGIDNCSIAYRKIPRLDNSNRNKCNIHFAKEVFDFIKNNNQECVAFVADITGFFDNLDHEHLKKEWLGILDMDDEALLPEDHAIIYKNLTRFKYVEVEKIYKQFGIKLKKIKHQDKDGKIKVYTCPVMNGKVVENILHKPYYREFQEKVVNAGLIKGNENRNERKKCSAGIMQGAPISATLSNVYMISFDKYINEVVSKVGGLYKRYSDDLVIVCSIDKYEDLKTEVLNEIQKYELEIEKDKTKATFFLKDELEILRGYTDEKKDKIKNMQYLGFDFDGRNIFIRCNSLTRYYRRMKMTIRKAVNMTYGKSSKTKGINKKVFRRRLHKKYLYSGRRSFISYALRANEIIGGRKINQQVSNRFSIMRNYINERVRRKSSSKN